MVTLTVNGTDPHVRRRRGHAAALVSPRRSAPDRHPVRLRRRACAARARCTWTARRSASCQTPLRTLQNKRVVTIEGLSPDGTHPVQRAWDDAQRRAVRLLPDRPDHAGGVAADAHAESDRRRTSIAPWRATSAAAAPISASAPRSRRRQRSGHERHRKRQPAPVPRRRRSRPARSCSPRACCPSPRGRRRRRRRSAPRRIRRSLNPSVYLGIEPDGTVFIVTHRSEMGTGIRTTLPHGRGRRARRRLEPRAASSRASAMRATAIRTPTARARFATSTKRSATPARRRGRCW